MADRFYRTPQFGKIEMRLVRAPWYGGADILVREGNAVGVAVELEERPEGQPVEPTLRIDDDVAQTLMDDLWSAGYRPTEGSGSAGSMRATEKHLEDMRKIASKKLGVEL